jgi:hypothetical protein
MTLNGPGCGGCSRDLGVSIGGMRQIDHSVNKESSLALQGDVICSSAQQIIGHTNGFANDYLPAGLLS